MYAEVDGWSIEDGELVLSAGGDEVLRYAAATDRWAAWLRRSVSAATTT